MDLTSLEGNGLEYSQMNSLPSASIETDNRDALTIHENLPELSLENPLMFEETASLLMYYRVLTRPSLSTQVKRKQTMLI